MCRCEEREGEREKTRTTRCIDAHGQVLCAFLLEQSAPRGIGTPLSTPLSTIATELPTELVAVGQLSVNTGWAAGGCILRASLFQSRVTPDSKDFRRHERYQRLLMHFLSPV